MPPAASVVLVATGHQTLAVNLTTPRLSPVCCQPPGDGRLLSVQLPGSTTGGDTDPARAAQGDTCSIPLPEQLCLLEGLVSSAPGVAEAGGAFRVVDAARWFHSLSQVLLKPRG